MSFEGYYQCLCSKGHEFDAPYDYGGDANVFEDFRCYCGRLAVLINLVDDTNCDSCGELKFESSGKSDEHGELFNTSWEAEHKLVDPEDQMQYDLPPLSFQQQF